MKAGRDLHMLLMKFMNKDFLKFLFVGGLNTVITYLIYLLFIIYFQYKIAYGIAYVVGIVSSYLMNSMFVFKARLSIRTMIKFPLVYLLQFIISILLLYFCVDFININEKLAPLIVIAITIPATFLLSKYILIGNTSNTK